MMTPQGPSHKPEGDPSRLAPWAAFMAMGISSAVIVALAVVLGIVADGAFHSSPLCLFLGILVGCAAAVASAVAQMKRFL